MKSRVIIILMVLIPIFSYSQKSYEFTLGVGGTFVDLDRLVDLDESSSAFASDWDMTSFGLSGQYFFASKGPMSIGAELMYQYLYWYSVEIPLGIQTIYRDYGITALKVTPIFRYEIGEAIGFDIGPEFNFMDGMKLGMLFSANYNLRISSKVEVPIKLRFDLVNNILMTMPVTLNAGVKFNL